MTSAAHSSSTRQLNVLQKDAITELMNIGVGHAASTLHTLIGHKIELVVPEVSLITLDDYHQLQPYEADELLSTIWMGFRGGFEGNTSLIFPTDSANTLITALTGEMDDSPELDELRAGTLAEVGNILLNGVMGSIANMLNAALSYTVPEYMECSLLNIFRKNHTGNDTIMLARTTFAINELKVEGNILLFFKVASFEQLLISIDRELAI
ncbi:chemotaxis protein CheC [Mariprofundus erugo]|nr:chemotaxis protein CheC [Mariprofundus erugo]